MFQRSDVFIEREKQEARVVTVQMLTVSGPLATGCSAADDPPGGALQGHIQAHKQRPSLEHTLESNLQEPENKNIFTILIQPVSVSLH